MKNILMKNSEYKLDSLPEISAEYANSIDRIGSIQMNAFNKANEAFVSALEEYLRNNLKEIGYEFKKQSDFYDFIKKRVARIGFTKYPNEYELWLDFGTKEQRCVGLYNDTVHFNFEKNKVSVSVGKSPRIKKTTEK